MDALLGAYVLDALEPEERALVEEYLEQNPRARAEVDDLRETVAVLATEPLTDTTAPPELWERIAAEVGEEQAADDALAARRERRAMRRVAWVSSAVAVAAAIVAVVLGIRVITLNDDLHDARDPANVAGAFERATHVEGARAANLVEADQTVARVVLLPNGTGYLVNDKLEPLGGSKSYQLWAVFGGGEEQYVISAGLLGSHPGAASFKIDGPVAAFALTVEGEGGAPQPTQRPFAAGALA
jgi:anti-sigma-K factor RskA